MRVALLTAGGYPYRRDPLAGFCRELVDGLGQHLFHLLTVTHRRRHGPPAYPLPPHVASARTVAISTPVQRAAPADAHRDATTAAVLLCRGLFGSDEHGDAMFSAGLRRLAAVAGCTTEPLGGVPVADVLTDAWQASRAAPRGASQTLPLPALSARDAHHTAALLRRASRALAVRLPAVDLTHCLGGTAAVLAALAGQWRNGTPVLLTEARSAAEPRPGDDRLPAAVRTLLHRFRAGVAHAGYLEAGAIAAISGHHRDSTLRHGIDPAKVLTVPGVADPRTCVPVADASPRPSLLCLRADSGPALDLLLAGFGRILTTVPGATLHLVADARDPRRVAALRQRIGAAGLAAAVRLRPLPSDRRRLYADGQVLVHLPAAGDGGQQLIEAMMCARPVVAPHVGPVGDTLGGTGVLVPDGDPAALAVACVDLLRDRDLRWRLGASARRRALANFVPGRLARAYDALYEDVTAPPAPVIPRHEFELAIPAPRLPRPTTIAG